MNIIVGAKTRKMDVSVYPTGKIELSAHVVRQLDCSEGDTIGLVKEGPERYLCVLRKHGVGRGSTRACMVNPGNHFMRIWSKALARALYLELSIEPEAKVSLYCGEPIDTAHGRAIPLITKNPMIWK